MPKKELIYYTKVDVEDFIYYVGTLNYAYKK